MKFRRACGTLVHPTSFPSAYGIGDLGPAAYRFIDFLEGTHQSIWQVLPLGPTGYGNSPYASYSAFAGNHYLISPDILVSKGLIDASEAEAIRTPVTTRVDYERAYAVKEAVFKKASARFYGQLNGTPNADFEAFKKNNAYWLDDYTLFIAALEANGRQPWNTWDKGLAQRRKKSMADWRKKLSDHIDYHYWLQFEFFTQWMALKEYANSKDIHVVGDIPIFVDHNSSDVWSHPGYFEVDKDGNRLLVAGVPPDYFSATGQLWGNPLYKWKALEKDNFSWWVERFRQMFVMYDAIRVDHFRGFDAYWEVQADAETAINGRWVKGPGRKLFDTILHELGDLPIIAEDLGVITPEVVELRDGFGFPGMKILQFAMSGDPANSFLPHNFDTSNCVVYTGTHDNDTTRGWYAKAPQTEQHWAREYTRSDGSQIHLEMIRLGIMSAADMAIFPLQDFMGLETEHRMNLPGTTVDNWIWRYTDGMLARVDAAYLRHMVGISNRNTRARQTDTNIVELETEQAN
ncbi:MAG: 4-alpha-glucanotransferase MalQ [Bacteroidetes bacterium HLUCCA01]|nr:MAG: 4-alpha-glucanotransferase MalQ [Bacteroidetes bacterium HLUCCA01]